jgi:MFS family permease
MTSTKANAAAVPLAVRSGIRLGVITGIACAAQFMVVLDVSIANVAGSAMRADLGLSAGQQHWVVMMYLLSFGGLLLLAARLGDVLRRGVVWQSGLALFTAGSLGGGLAMNAPVLLAARAVQGAGAALLAPAGLSLITAGVRDPRARSAAITLAALATATMVFGHEA